MKFTQKIFSKFNANVEKKRIYAAIQSQDWPLVLRLRRKTVENAPNISSNWLQYGHALKECGYYDMADEAYAKAQKISPESKEIILQRGHLEKLRGNTEKAFELYCSARENWPGDTTHVQTEVDHLKKLARTISSRGIFPSKSEIDCPIYISSVCKIFEENDRGDMNRRIGRADYSYAFALKGFATALDNLGIDYQILNEVAGIPDIREISSSKKVIHIGFYPPEKINLLKGAYNIICFAWEFERLRLPSENPSYNAFSDQATMLNLADEIWVPSKHGVESIKPSLNNIVTYMPSPAIFDQAVRGRRKPSTKRALIKTSASLKNISWVPLNVLPRLQNVMSNNSQKESSSIQKIISRKTENDPIVYVSIFNAHDYRKNIDSLIRGFDAFSKEYPHAYLFLKLADDQKPHEGPNGSLLHGQMSSPSSLVPSISSENIWLTWDAFTRDQMNGLFDLSRFYICSAIAEGQNLPLIESMTRKSVPISVRHTAMEDYIYDHNSIIINHKKIKAPIEFSQRYKIYGVSLDFSDEKDVYNALVKSTLLSEEEYSSKSISAFDTVSSVFGPNRIAERLEELLSQDEDLS